MTSDTRILDAGSLRIDRFLDNLPLAVFRTTPQGKVVYANREAAKVLGFGSVRELENAAPFPGPDLDVLFEELSRDGQVAFLPICCRGRDDTAVLCTVTARIANDDDGRRFADGVLYPVRNSPPEVGMTAPRTGTGRSLDRNVTVILDSDGKIININTAGAAFFRLDKAALVGRPVHEVIVPVYHDLVAMFLSDVLEGTQRKGRMTVRDGFGAQRTIEYAAFLEDRPGGGKRIRCTAHESAPGADRADKGRGQVRAAAKELTRLAHPPLAELSRLVKDLASQTSARDLRADVIREISSKVGELGEILTKLDQDDSAELSGLEAGARPVDLEQVS